MPVPRCAPQNALFAAVRAQIVHRPSPISPHRQWGYGDDHQGPGPARCGRGPLLDYLGDLEHDLVGEGDAERLGRLQSDHEVEGHGLLDGEIGGLG
jgi:hypothetical protein